MSFHKIAPVKKQSKAPAPKKHKAKPEPKKPATRRPVGNK